MKQIIVKSVDAMVNKDLEASKTILLTYVKWLFML